jgi:putative endopeptidase
VATFEVIPGYLAKAEATVREDVADLGGFAITYNLWCDILEERGLQGEELNEQKRAFFLKYASLFFEKHPESYMIKRLKDDTHSAGHIRINSVVQHIDDWYELFDVKEGDALYLAPEDRIVIW